MHGEHHYSRNWGALVAVALAHKNSGRTRLQFVHAAGALAQLVALDDKRPGREARYLHRAWDQAEAMPPAAFVGAEKVTAAVQAVRARGDADRWSGQAGNSTRAALEAVLAVCEQARTLSPLLAVRTVAELAGVGKSTAGRALERLLERGYLVRVKGPRYDRAATYRLVTPAELGHTLPPDGVESVSHLRTPEPPALLTYLQSDAFHARALGRTAARVLAFLDELEPVTTAALAERLGLTARTVRQALDRLEAVGAVQRHQAGKALAWTGRPDQLDHQEVAEAYDTRGRLQARVETFTIERTWYQDNLEYLRARRLHRPVNRRAIQARQAVERVTSTRRHRLQAGAA